MSSGWIVPLGRRAPGLKTQMGVSPRRSLLWGYGGVNIRPMAVSAPEDFNIDFDEFIEGFRGADEPEEDFDLFEEFIEYLDNQEW